MIVSSTLLVEGQTACRAVSVLHRGSQNSTVRDAQRDAHSLHPRLTTTGVSVLLHEGWRRLLADHHKFRGRIMKTLITFGAISVLLGAAACSSPTTTPGPAPDPGTTGTVGSTTDKNPVGEAYPTTNLGHVAHTRIRNLKFVGYKAKDASGQVDTTGTTTTIQLSDYYNPTGKNGNYKVIHLSAASRWCGPCNDETSLVSGYSYQSNSRTAPGVAADVLSKGVIFVQALIDGFTPGIGAKTDDLQGWISDHQSNFTEMLDPGPTAFASFFTGAAVPWNADIDARSMEILNTELGYSTTLEADVLKWATWTDTHPAMQ
jgi:hypothetical protein